MTLRRIHVDQGRLATNRASAHDHPVLRLDDPDGAELARGHELQLRCGCGCVVGRFVQPAPDKAHFLVADETAVEPTR